MYKKILHQIFAIKAKLRNVVRPFDNKIISMGLFTRQTPPPPVIKRANERVSLFLTSSFALVLPPEARNLQSIKHASLKAEVKVKLSHFCELFSVNWGHNNMKTVINMVIVHIIVAFKNYCD
jgi:hypothetical protein